MKKGFGLIELVVVLVIIAIFVAIGIPQYDKLMEQGKLDEAKTNLLAMYMAQQVYKLNNSSIGYINCNSLSQCISEDYLNLDLNEKYFNYECAVNPVSGVLTCWADRTSGKYTRGVDEGCKMMIASSPFSFITSGGTTCVVSDVPPTDYQQGKIGVCDECP
ncbi:MAG: prepilin-type N-terminal cleavage/methylation domain-containing protein [Candidatus Omnitrophica bacterium]|nr:prepilin-type N-terminal cleavage/methylation domain-containing protein [Candidatus Omnitrophota bacterium]